MKKPIEEIRRLLAVELFANHITELFLENPKTLLLSRMLTDILVKHYGHSDVEATQVLAEIISAAHNACGSMMLKANQVAAREYVRVEDRISEIIQDAFKEQ